jgi:hypothetical protein
LKRRLIAAPRLLTF